VISINALRIESEKTDMRSLACRAWLESIWSDGTDSSISCADGSPEYCNVVMKVVYYRCFYFFASRGDDNDGSVFFDAIDYEIDCRFVAPEADYARFQPAY
jgi:hypothetical protein